MAASSINVNLSAKLDVCFTVFLQSGQVVEANGGPDAALLLPINCTETLALTDANASIESGSEPEPIPSCSRELVSESKNQGPLTESMMRSLKAKFESLFDGGNLPNPASSPLLVTSPTPASSPRPVSSPTPASSPTPMLDLPLLPLTLTFPTNSTFVNADSPESPSFLSIDPNDLFWIPLPFTANEESFVESVQSVVEKNGNIVVEMAAVDDNAEMTGINDDAEMAGIDDDAEMAGMDDDDDVVFLGECRKS